MVMKAQIQAEPIPGYRLIERLGQGGFGEVWKAEAPGGLHKAIKFVHGTLQSAAEESGGVHQELKSLNRVKTVRHPYILSLERYDIIEGQLLIVMELADKNLWDRFKECTGQGLPGIARDELLRYMEEAAEALDLMNIQYGLQHLDIKPQNLFLVHNHVKVADFGLVKDLEGMNTQVTGGVTPIYAAPETFDGVISRYCDQYNLAIVYQELLTGHRPYTGTTARQLLMQHMTGTPDLSALSEGDRPVIARSLSKKPEERFPSCTDMVQALRQAGQVVTPGSEPVRVAPTGPYETPSHPRTFHTPTPATPILEKPAPKPPPQARPELTGDGVLCPALIVGVGKVGLKVLQQVRLSLHEQLGSSVNWPHIRFLYIDTDPESAEKANQITADGMLDPASILLTRLNRPSYYLKPARNRAALESWLNYSMVCRVPRNQTTTEGLRLLGRLAFFDNYRAIQDALRQQLEACAEPAALQNADRQTRLGIRSNRPRVYLTCGLGGGTGSGMFLDLAYAARTQLANLGVQPAEVNGLLLLPPATVKNRQSPGLVNAFAALTELNHFSSPEEQYLGHFDDGEGPIYSSEPPFHRCVMLPLPEESSDTGPLREATQRAGDFLCRELASALGRDSEAGRGELPPPEEPGLFCATFGSYRFFVPRRALRRRASRAFIRLLLQRWLDPQQPGLKKAVRGRIDEQCSRLQLEPDALVEALQAACKQALGRDPEVLFADILQRYLSQEGNFDYDTAEQTLDDLDQLLGRPVEEGSEELHGPMIEALDAAAGKLQVEWENKLHQLIQGMIDDSRFRIVGAEEAGAQVLAMLQEVLGTHQSLGEEMSARAEEAHLTIGELVNSLTKGSWWPGRMNKMTADLRQTLTLYAKLRYQTLLIECVLDVYGRLQEKLPKRLEELGFCRQRLTFVYEGVDDSRRKLEIGAGRAFLPGGAATAEEALETLVESIRAEDLLEIDTKIQSAIRRQFKSLVAACLGDDDQLGELIHILRSEANSWIDGQLGTESVADRYLEGMASEAELTADLSAVLEQAAPELAGSRSSPESELCFLMVPNDPSGEQLGRAAQSCALDLRVLSAAAGDIYFYRERPYLPLADLPQLGLMAEEAYRHLTAAGHFSPHTRSDITEWRPLG